MTQVKYLSDLKPKDKAKVKKINSEMSLKQKLLDMGIIPGSTFEVIKLAPLGDPIDIKIKGYHLSLRKQEAACIIVEEEICRP